MVAAVTILTSSDPHAIQHAEAIPEQCSQLLGAGLELVGTPELKPICSTYDLGIVAIPAEEWNLQDSVLSDALSVSKTAAAWTKKELHFAKSNVTPTDFWESFGTEDEGTALKLMQF